MVSQKSLKSQCPLLEHSMTKEKILKSSTVIKVTLNSILKASIGGEGVDRGRDGWMASLAQWT